MMFSDVEILLELLLLCLFNKVERHKAGVLSSDVDSQTKQAWKLFIRRSLCDKTNTKRDFCATCVLFSPLR